MSENNQITADCFSIKKTEKEKEKEVKVKEVKFKDTKHSRIVEFCMVLQSRGINWKFLKLAQLAKLPVERLIPFFEKYISSLDQLLNDGTDVNEVQQVLQRVPLQT